MIKSFLVIATMMVALNAAGCGARNAGPKTALPLVSVRTATMDITPGITVLTRIALPNGFVLDPNYQPMWLQNGKELGVVGKFNNKLTVLGFSGPAWRTRRTIVQDGNSEEPDGKIVDLALSPDSMTLALAEVNRKADKLDVAVRDVIATDGGGYPVASFDGNYRNASVSWIDQFTIGLTLEPAESPVAPPAAPTAKAPAQLKGLSLIGINGMVMAGFVKLNCDLSHVIWSPVGDYAVGEGSLHTPVVVIDRHNSSCISMSTPAPIHLLGWSDDGKAFLYQQLRPADQIGAYRFDIGNGSRLVAVSSGAAAFLSDGETLALGNAQLTFRRAASNPNAPLLAQIAVSGPRGAEIKLQSLGFNSTPALLAQSSMSYSRESDLAAIATFSSSEAGILRKLVIYSVSDKTAFQVAFGPAQGPVLTSWSPHGQYLAILDGDTGAGSALTVLLPPSERAGQL